jgi:hypothetical protein
MRWAMAAFVLLVVGACTGVVNAGDGLLGFGSKVEADPNKNYPLTANDGAYVIYVASFRGDDAEALAKALVYELRAEYKLPAFLFRRLDEEALAERERLKQLQAERGEEGIRPRKVRVLEEFAVVIGGYRTQEEARKALPELKARPAPKNLPAVRLRMWQDPFSMHREGRKEEPKVLQDGAVNPFRHAFVTRNPLTPRPTARHDYDAQQMQALNASEKFSLLRNPEPYTLVVMVFRATDSNPDQPSIFDLNPRMANNRARLSQAPWQQALMLAEHLANQLHDGGKGYETYLLHLPDATVVTVGGFKSPTDPALLAAQRQLARLNVGGIQLFDLPYPMEVPGRRQPR